MSLKKILIVEDEAIVVRDISTQLEIMGYAIAGACASAEAALEMIDGTPPDLVVMDIQLSGIMDGVQAAGIIRDRYDIPVVFLTSFTGGEVFERAKKQDPFGYILKPFEERELQIVIEMALYKHAMQAQMRLQSQALAVAANAIVITDPKGLVVWTNKAFLKQSGYTEPEAIGQNVSALVKSGRHEPSFYSRMWATIQRGEVWEGELINRRKDGSTFQEHMTITPMFGPQGNITHYIAIKQDITEQKNLEKMYLRAQRLESIGTLAGGVAHDLNNILSPIIMSADLLLKDSESEEQREMLAMIVQSAQRGAEIVKQVLSFARGTEGQDVEVQIRHLLSDLIRICQETFTRKIQIINDVPRNLWPVNADPSQMHQVMMNLLVNARDAMPEGGTLRVSAENLKLDAENFSGESEAHLKPGSYIQVSVQDTGCGIAPEVLSKIFDPFFTTKSMGNGTGLGLPTAQRIIHKQGGHIRVLTEEGKGSTFHVLIPAQGDVGAPDIPPVISELPRGHGERILVVEDEESLRWMMRGTLEHLGYKVTLAKDGVEALELLAAPESEYDLMILDMMMPNLDGHDVLAEIKGTRPELPVLLMSGLAERFDGAEKGKDAHPSLNKPFTMEEMAGRLREILPAQ